MVDRIEIFARYKSCSQSDSRASLVKILNRLWSISCVDGSDLAMTYSAILSALDDPRRFRALTPIHWELLDAALTSLNTL